MAEIKYIILLLAFLFVGTSFAQTVLNDGSTSTLKINKGGFQVDSIITFPARDTIMWHNRWSDILKKSNNYYLRVSGGYKKVLVQGDIDTTHILFGKLEVNGSGPTYTLPSAPIQNSVIATVNGKSENVSFPTATQVQINAAYTIDAGDKVKITYTYYP